MCGRLPTNAVQSGTGSLSSPPLVESFGEQRTGEGVYGQGLHNCSHPVEVWHSWARVSFTRDNGYILCRLKMSDLQTSLFGEDWCWWHRESSPLLKLYREDMTMRMLHGRAFMDPCTNKFEQEVWGWKLCGYVDDTKTLRESVDGGGTGPKFKRRLHGDCCTRTMLASWFPSPLRLKNCKGWPRHGLV